MKMRKSISKIMALLLAVTVMVSMIAVPAMASGMEKPQYTEVSSLTTYTCEQFNADLNAATNYAFFNFEEGTTNWSNTNEFEKSITGTENKLKLSWNSISTNIKVASGNVISGDNSVAIKANADSTLTISDDGALKATSIGWLVTSNNTTEPKRTSQITVNYSDGTESIATYSMPLKGTKEFWGVKAPSGKYIRSIELGSCSTIVYFDDICVIMGDPYARDYYRADRVTGGDMTDYTMEQFVSALDNAEYKIVENFDGDELTTDFAKADSDGWLTDDIIKNYSVSDEQIRFTWESSKFKWIDDGSTYVVSGTKCLVTGSGDTYLTFTQNGDFKIAELGFAVSELNLNSAPTFEVSYSGGTKETVSDAVSKAKVPHFYGFKAPEGEYITRLVIKSGTYSYVDDLCLILEDTGVDYTDLEYATEMLKIYGDNFTEYVPLDAFGAQQDANTNRVTISWASSDPTVVETSGKVNPVVGVEKKVKLTATLTDTAGNTATKEFTVTIPAVSEYVIEGVKLTGTDGLIDTQLVAGKKIEKISVKRYEKTRQNITVVTALYDRSKALADVKIETVTPAIAAQAHGDITLTNPMTLPADITGYTAKIMLLSSKNELVPLCESYTVNPMSNDITVFMVGDSLTADYTDYYYPRTGWGSCVDDYINGITVDNIAVSGMSTKTFMSNGTKLPYLEENVKEGDYIFLMYGHNDQKIKSIEDDVTENGIKTKKWVNQHSGIGTYGEVVGDTLSYFGYISNIVEVAREKKANIVFFTQFARATNGLEGLLGYPEALTAFANAQNLPVIDTTTPSLDLYDKLLKKGEELVTAGAATDEVSFANNIFLHLTKDDPRYINDSRFTSSSYHTKEDDSIRKDNTHFNLYGAQVRARLAVLGLIDAYNALARFEKVSDTDFDALCSNVINEILATEYYGKAN